MENSSLSPTSMNFFYESSRDLASELYISYTANAKSLIANIKQDKTLSSFDTFNKRFKISWGMRIEFTDSLSIIREETRNCYVLMLKISDIWFALEHLIDTASTVIPKDANATSTIDMYQGKTLNDIGFEIITANFNELLQQHVLHKSSNRKELYLLFAYLKNNTKGGTRKLISEIINLIEEKQKFQPKHVFAVAYGLRNMYVHKGVAAALGSSNYKLKRIFYSILYDSLILYSLALGNSYCSKCLANLECK